MLLYSAVISAIGFMCATVFRWPAMLCIAGLMTLVSFFFYLSTGFSLGQAFLYAVLSLFLLQIFYVVGGFVTSFSVRRLAARKKNIEA